MTKRKKKKSQEFEFRNYVAKYAHQFNKHQVHKDKKKYSRKIKHKNAGFHSGILFLLKISF